MILFDILAESKAIEHIDYAKPNKFDRTASFLAAVSGKSKESITEQLKETRLTGLYSYSTQGELKQLISILTNLSTITREAGFRSVALKAEKRLRELECITVQK